MKFNKITSKMRVRVCLLVMIVLTGESHGQGILTEEEAKYNVPAPEEFTPHFFRELRNVNLNIQRILPNQTELEFNKTYTSANEIPDPLAHLTYLRLKSGWLTGLNQFENIHKEHIKFFILENEWIFSLQWRNIKGIVPYKAKVNSLQIHGDIQVLVEPVTLTIGILKMPSHYAITTFYISYPERIHVYTPALNFWQVTQKQVNPLVSSLVKTKLQIYMTTTVRKAIESSIYLQTNRPVL